MIRALILYILCLKAFYCLKQETIIKWRKLLVKNMNFIEKVYNKQFLQLTLTPRNQKISVALLAISLLGLLFYSLLFSSKKKPNPSPSIHILPNFLPQLQFEIECPLEHVKNREDQLNRCFFFHAQHLLEKQKFPTEDSLKNTTNDFLAKTIFFYARMRCFFKDVNALFFKETGWKPSPTNLYDKFKLTTVNWNILEEPTHPDSDPLWIVLKNRMGNMRDQHGFVDSIHDLFFLPFVLDKMRECTENWLNSDSSWKKDALMQNSLQYLEARLILPLYNDLDILMKRLFRKEEGFSITTQQQEWMDRISTHIETVRSSLGNKYFPM